MSKAFSFGFGGGDIDCGEAEDMHPADEPPALPIDSPPALKPELHSFEHLLSFLPSHISYSMIAIGYNENLMMKIPRRELFDIRTQIMAQDETPNSEPKFGLTDDDITPNVYEGGYKTWECSIDLAHYLSANFNHVVSGREPAHARLHLVELGAGSALPSLVVFSSLLSRPKTNLQASPPVYLTLCDYNVSVLTHSTLPNLFLVWCASTSLLWERPEEDIDVTPEILGRFTTDLAERKIHIKGVSGAWGQALVDLLPRIQGDGERPVSTLVLASETIYAVPTLIPFTETLTTILQNAESDGNFAFGMVAVKLVYFGVGGGVDDFLEELGKLEGQSEILWEKTGVGVGRVILGVKLMKR